MFKKNKKIILVIFLFTFFFSISSYAKIDIKVIVNNEIALNFFRETSSKDNVFIHQGIYAFKYKTLKNFVSWEPSDNEKKYKLEQLRALDNGIRINAIKSVSKIHLVVDTEEDLKKANEIAKEDSYK